jgi:hypothetical protein
MKSRKERIIITEPEPGHLSVKCRCGLEITVSNQYGMFCKKLCGLKDAKAASKEMDKFIKRLLRED